MNKLIYISATWCNPCKLLSPIVDKVAMSGIPVKKVDADRDHAFISPYRVRTVPTIIKIDASGNEIARISGVASEKQIVEFYNKK
jgi:thioredoxin-like negative regulator of GroEL|tara:strand:- start:169 stop:423 length:255 start_codon:yes stop_codon:yes gene_type:complete